jgi:hypothetical protein
VSTPIALPSFFQYSQRFPVESRNGEASIEPPSSTWLIRGEGDLSTYGPSGFDATATPTACRPEAVSADV